jgi:hypothetical protein
MASLRICHLALGGVGLVLFVLTGQYMAHIATVPELPDTERLLYRSSHIYLLLACVANVFAGAAMQAGQPRDTIQRLCSLLLLLSPLLLAWSFFTDIPADGLERPTARLALYLLFGASSALVLQVVASAYRGRGKRKA